MQRLINVRDIMGQQKKRYRLGNSALVLLGHLSPAKLGCSTESYALCPICRAPRFRLDTFAVAPLGRRCNETNDAKAQLNSSRASADSSARNPVVVCQCSDAPSNAYTFAAVAVFASRSSAIAPTISCPSGPYASAGIVNRTTIRIANSKRRQSADSIF